VSNSSFSLSYDLSCCISAACFDILLILETPPSGQTSYANPFRADALFVLHYLLPIGIPTTAPRVFVISTVNFVVPNTVLFQAVRCFLGLSSPAHRVILANNFSASSTDLRHGRFVALKVLEVDVEDYNAHAKNVNIETTLHEIKILGELSGGKIKNVNPLLDAFSLHSQIWIVNEYCPGGSIKTLVSLNL